MLTVGQYLRPTRDHLPVVRYWHPDEFAELEREAYAMGFESVAAGPLVRSSYHAEQTLARPQRAESLAGRTDGFRTLRRLIPLKDNIPTRRFPLITVALIVINIAMFFGFQHAHWNGGGFQVSEKNTIEYAYIPYELTHPGKHCGDSAVLANGERVTTNGAALCEGKRVTGETTAGPVDSKAVKVKPDPQPSTFLTILTAMFMHGGLLHIAGNMLFLWIFGNNVEDSMGKLKFIAFYLLGGLAATLLQTVVGPNSTTPNLGASGAIAAVLGAYALLYPRARVVTLIFIIFFVTVVELPALLVLGGWFLLQVLDASQPVGGGGGSPTSRTSAASSSACSRSSSSRDACATTTSSPGSRSTDGENRRACGCAPDHRAAGVPHAARGRQRRCGLPGSHLVRDPRPAWRRRAGRTGRPAR